MKKSVVESSTKNVKTPFTYYYFLSEILVLLTLISIYIWIIVMYQPPNSVIDEMIPRRLPSLVSILLITLGLVYILNNFVYVFSIKPSQRMFASLLRIVSISSISIFAVICMNRVNWEFKYYFIFSFALYACYSFTILRVFLVSNKNKTSKVFFQHLSLQDKQRSNQTKSEFISGILALVTGIFLVQFLWIIYHYKLRSNMNQIFRTNSKLM